MRATFDPDYRDGATTYVGTFHGDPRYQKKQSDPRDIAVVVLVRAVPTRHAVLAAPRDERREGRSRHLLRRLGWAELPRQPRTAAATTITGDATCRACSASSPSPDRGDGMRHRAPVLWLGMTEKVVVHRGT